MSRLVIPVHLPSQVSSPCQVLVFGSVSRILFDALAVSLIYFVPPVTGTSAGIGQASVREVIADGDRVAAITRKASSVSVLYEAYASDKLLVVEYDVGNPTQNVEALFEKVHRHFGRIDVVVNNAGYGLNSVVEGTSDEDARYQFEVNFWGAARISREVRTCPPGRSCRSAFLTHFPRLSSTSENTKPLLAESSTFRL